MKSGIMLLFLVKFKGNKAEMTEEKHTVSAFNKTLDLVNKGLCYEISGIERSSEP